MAKGYNFNNKETLKTYAKYSSLVLQMVVMVLTGAWGGKFLDMTFHSSFPIFTVVLILLMAFLAIWLLFRTILKK